MPRPATIGPEIFKRVNELVAEGKRRSEAFALVGEERGSSPGTVSANYYRVARAQAKRRGQRPAGRSPRRTTAPAARQTATRPHTSEATDIRQVADEIVKLTQRLVRQVEERDKKLRSLLG
jgi:sirohydrochlorin ferrochelatase